MSAILVSNPTSINDIVSGISTLATANGWTVDYSAAGRVHIHKGGLHFDIYSYDAHQIGIVGCSGYAAGSAATAQPGASPVSVGYVFDISVSGNGYVAKYRMVASEDNIYVTVLTGCSFDPGFTYRFFGFGNIVDKVGSWSGGQFVLGAPGSSGYNNSSSMGFDNASLLRVLINGSWAPNTSYGWGTSSGISPTISGKMPNKYNAGLMPLPIPLFVRNIADSSKLHPIGFAPNTLRISGGDCYLQGDTFIMGGSTYTAVSHRPDDTSATYAIKIA